MGPDVSDRNTCPERIFRKYEIYDVCGQRDEAIEEIIVHDTKAPNIVNKPPDINTDCFIPAPYKNYTQFHDDGGLVFDNCGKFSLEFVGDVFISEDCPRVIQRTYQFVDLCGNVSAPYKQIITVIDSIPPEITCPPAVSYDGGLDDLVKQTGLAYSDTVQNIKLSKLNSLGITVSDNCDIREVTYQDEVAGECNITVTRTFKVYDTCGNESSCTQTIEMYFEQPVSLKIKVDRDEVMQGEQVTFTATPVNGGTVPVYTWIVNGVEVPGETQETFTYIPEDGDVVYAVVVSDLACAVNNPATSNVITISTYEPEKLSVISNVADVLCYSDSTGSITLAVGGDFGGFKFEWSTGDTTQNISNVPAGDYTVKVSDSSGADTTITVTVNQPDSLLITFTKTDNEYSEIPIGSIDLTVEGGTGSYSYAWIGPNGFTASAADINQLEAGTYLVVVTDANGCQNTKEVVITRKNPNFIINCPPPVEVPCMSDLPAAATTIQQFIAAGRNGCK